MDYFKYMHANYDSMLNIRGCVMLILKLRQELDEAFCSVEGSNRDKLKVLST